MSWDSERNPGEPTEAELKLECDAAERDGRDAFLAGTPKSGNPFSTAWHQFDRHCAWIAGWDLQEQDEYERAADTVSVAELQLARRAA